MNYEKLDNDQKELVKHWIDKYKSECVYTSSFIDDVKFFDEHLKSEPFIKVGKYYKGNKQNNSKIMYYCTSVDQNGDPLGYGFNVDGNWVNNDARPWTCKVIEISEDEWSGRVIEESKRKGYKPGIKVISVHDNYTRRIIEGSLRKLSFIDILYFSNATIYENGKWAEIIDEKAEVRAEIQELQDRLEQLKSKL